ncbi:MAG: hypothetical protein ABI887_02205 [Burkholderiales bacterium]
MTMNKTRLDDRLNGAAFAVVVAIVLSIGSAMVSLEVDTYAPATAQAAAPAHTAAPAQVVAVTAVAAVR